jgi:hypothetical protein
MPRLTRLTAAVLLGAVLAGCGSDATPARTGQAVRSEAVAAQAASKDAAAKRLIDSYKKVKGQTAAATKQRLAVIDKLGETDSDAAATFLLLELDRIDAEPEAVQDKLVPGVVAALAELDEDEVAPKQKLELMTTSEAIAASANTTEARRKRRRFNVWDILRKHFKKKKRKSGGGGGAPPAPPAPPAM